MVPRGYPALVFLASRDSRVVVSFMFLCKSSKTMHVESRENEVLCKAVKP